MRRYVRFLWLLLVCLLLQMLAGCSATSQKIASATPTAVVGSGSAALTDVDWANFTYSSSCYGKLRPFHAVNGVALNNGVRLQVLHPVYGDLTGEGRPEAAIPYICASADFGGERVFVYGGNATHPILMGDLPEGNGSGGNSMGSVDTVTISNGVITLSGAGYGPGEARCCPGLLITTSYRWDGSHFVVVSNHVASLTPTPTAK